MPQNFKEIIYVVGNKTVLNNMPAVKPLPIFDDGAINFLNALSQVLMKEAKAFSDVITFAFWCRRAALVQEKKNYEETRLGKGVVFHSTPSNVAVNFAFSFAAGLLAGNANIIRLPAKNFEQVSVICAAINQLLGGDFACMKPYILMVKFPTVREIIDAMSAIADARVIWGGDNTISVIRQSPLKPRANEITFADRFSVLVIDAAAYENSKDKEKIIQNFYNDTYFSDQNACTSPRIIFWKSTGAGTPTAKEDFWQRVETKVAKEYKLSAVQAVGKLANLYKTAAAFGVRETRGANNFITRVNLTEISPDILEYKYNSGFFFERDIQNLTDIIPICTDKCQTITYLGLEAAEIKEFIKAAPKGADRIVPIGKSMDFSLIWDGRDLIRELSRIIIY